MRIRFQADADLHVPIIKGLKRRQPSIDFLTAHEAGLAGLDDRAVLARAASDGRVLVSHDVSTMPEEFSLFIQEQTSSGVILISQPTAKRSKGYCEFGQVLKRRIGRTCCRSCLDKIARRTAAPLSKPANGRFAN